MSLINQWQILCEELKLKDPSNVKIKEDLERIIFQSDRYIYEFTITVGGMGEIQSVFDNKLMRRVARKVLKHEHATDSVVRSRFIIEGQIISQLDHPNILPIYDMGNLLDKRPYFTMPIMRGATLQEIVGWRRRRGAAAEETALLASRTQVARHQTVKVSRPWLTTGQLELPQLRIEIQPLPDDARGRR